MNGLQLIDELARIAEKQGYNRGVSDGIILIMLADLSNAELVELIETKTERGER